MKTAIQFSGGIDSLACLWLYRGTPDVTAYWVKTDGAYPSMEEHIRKCCDAAGIPLRIVDGYRDIATYGYPNDLEPDTVLACCSRGLWVPMAEAMQKDGIQVIVRGQRDDDTLKGAVIDGYTDGGGTVYRLPIRAWTRAMVVDYVAENCPQLVHESYFMGEVTGRDCWDCTGYLFDNAQRIINLPLDKRELVLKQIGG